MRKVSIGTLIVALLIPLIVGVISAALSAKGMASYASLNKPPLSPPPWTFSVAWTILYLMMGLATYFVITAQADDQSKSMALKLYAIHLAMNFFWSILFFRWELRLFSFVWLIVMWMLVILCTCLFMRISKVAGLLMVPYVVWLTFAAYLNCGSYMLNRG